MTILRLTAMLIFILSVTGSVCGSDDESESLVVDVISGLVFPFGIGTREEFSEKLRDQFDTKLKLLKLKYDLDEKSTSAIEAAGHGDIERFFNRIDGLAGKYSGYTATDIERDQREFGPMMAEALQLQQEPETGLFGSGSLFRKVLRTQMSEDKWNQLLASERAQREEYIQSLAGAYVAAFERLVPMTARQLEQLTKLLVTAIENDPLETGYAGYIITSRLAFLPERLLVKFLDEKQLAGFRSYRRENSPMRDSLIKAGLMKANGDDNN